MTMISNYNKKIKMKALFVLTLSSFMSYYGVAQTLPSQCKAYMPKVLDKTTIFRADTKTLANNNYGQNGSTSKYWDAYSDRCDNVTYKGASKSSGESGKLKFNQKVRIAEIQNGFALVYTENKAGGVNYPQISGDVKCLGWIPMENLLLWNSCPTNEYGIYRKALIVRNIDQERDKSFGRISEHPDVNNTSHTSPLKSSIDFHYIMKEEGAGDNVRYLIAKYNKIGGGTITDQILEGWVSRNSFSAWNQRSCLEPNWNADDVEYFISKGEKAWLYSDASLTDETQPWSFGQKNSEGQPATQYRMPPRAMRFPILDNDSPKDDNFKITAFGAANGELGRQMVTMDEGKEKRDEALKKTAHINVIVVIDGTRSMGKYFNAMSNAVQKATQYLTGEVSVGAVIYRDYPDGENNVIEYHKMTNPNDAGLQGFLKNVGRNNYGASSSSADKTAHEALYLGIKTALDYKKMGYDSDHSNLIFIVGDCGNAPNDTKVSKSELLEMCKATNAQLFSFQVLNQEKAAWEDFNTQLTDIFVSHVSYLYSSLNSNAKVSWRPVKHGLGVKSNTKEHFYVSEMHRGQTGVELSEGELTDLIQDSYITFRKAIDEQLDAIENGWSGEGVMSSDATDADGTKGTSIKEEFLRRKLGADYEAVKAANALLAYTGYAKKDDGLNHDYWQAVVFLSSEELVELIKKLEKLKEAAKVNSYSTEDRANYVKAVAGIIQSMTEKSADEIEQLTTDEITRIIGGLNVSTPMLRGRQSEKVYTLSDIKNPKACPDEDFKRILKKMSTKIEDLSALPRSTNFKYSFTQNGVKSYWVPLEMIP